MHTTGACRGRFGADSADARPFGAGRDAYSPTPLNTNEPVTRPVGRGGSVPRDRRPGPARHAFRKRRIIAPQSAMPYGSVDNVGYGMFVRVRPVFSMIHAFGDRWGPYGASTAPHADGKASPTGMYACIHALKGGRRRKEEGSEYAEYTEYKFRNPYGSRAFRPILYAFGI